MWIPILIHCGARGLASDERQQLKGLEREVRELRRANEILKAASAFFARSSIDLGFP